MPRNTDDAVRAMVRAMQEADVMRRRLLSKGFTRPAPELAFTRKDADLYWCQKSQKWVCDIWKTADGDRVVLLTRKSHERLLNLLNSFM